MKVAEYIIKFLASRGVTHVFTLSGGMITPLLDAAEPLLDAKKYTVNPDGSRVANYAAPQLVACCHEQAAGFAAEGWARITGVPGVALATSGPGATNLLTAIGSCYFDGTPTVFITGQVRRDELRGDRLCRQLGFQELDIVSMAQHVTKSAFHVLDPNDIPRAMAHAFFVATEGRPGPVLLDIPIDVLQAEIEPRIVCIDLEKPPTVSPADALYAITALRESQRPLVLVGNGAHGALEEVRALLNKLWVPVVHSLMGVDVLTTTHPLRVGLIGSYGNRWANKALAECDTLLVLGSRLDVRQTGTNVDAFAKKRIIHVDVSAGEVNNRVKGVYPIIAQLGAFCTAVELLNEDASPKNAFDLTPHEWFERLTVDRRAWPDIDEQSTRAINPNVFMHALGHDSWDHHPAAFVVDVGQHQMWAAQSLELHGARFLTSGGMGAMGFALPAAIGAALATKGPVVMIAGDGGFQVNIHELDVVRRLGLPIKMVVMNNRSHGMVRQFQDQYFDHRLIATVVDPPSFTTIAEAYSINANAISRPEAIESGIKWLWRHPNRPAFLEVKISPEVNAYPKLVFGKGLDEMEPHFKEPIDD